MSIPQPRGPLPPRSSSGQSASARILEVASRQSQAILAAARADARRIRARAKNRHPSTNPQPTPTPVSGTTVAPTPTPLPAPTPTPTIPGAPNLTGVPKSWSIVVFNVDTAAHSLHIVNRSTGTLSGTVELTFVKRNGHVIGRRKANFANVPGRSVAALTMSVPPSHYASYRISVVHVH